MQISRSAVKVDGMTLLLDLATEVPGLLERADDLTSSDQHSDAAKLIEDMLALAGKIDRWHNSWSSWLVRSGFTVVAMERFPYMKTILGDDTTFEHAYKFPGFGVAYLHLIYWTCLCFLYAEILKIKGRYRDVPCSKPVMQIHRDLFQHVINMCQAVPWCCQPAAGSTGRFSLFVPLGFATKYFAKAGMFPQQKWCEKVGTIIYSSGIGPP